MLKQLLPRTILLEIAKNLDNPQALIIVGSRRTGKTSLLYLIRDLLIQKKKVQSKNILYYDLENEIIRQDFQVKNFDLIAKNLLAKTSAKKKSFVLLDEIQYLDNPAGLLKYLNDHYGQLKFIVSGSSSLKIKEKFSDSMVGRKKVFQLHPLSFKEFLEFKEKQEYLKLLPKVDLTNLKISCFELLPSSKQEIQRLFLELLTYGGYPEVVLAPGELEKKEILSEIYTSYLQKDINYLFDIDNVEKFNKLAQLFSSQIGSLVNFSELANTLGSARATIDRYSFLQENTFLLEFLKPFSSNLRKELTKMPKVFFEDTGLRNRIVNNFSQDELRPDIGVLAENFIYSELKKSYNLPLYFWRTKSKSEIDFVLKLPEELLPIEVKYQDLK
ncbi:ATP-binding protein, partial [Patescibacteria group bacterium]|nr:ATP-binding protein [Patescibacteria group bacterium]